MKTPESNVVMKSRLSRVWYMLFPILIIIIVILSLADSSKAETKNFRVVQNLTTPPMSFTKNMGQWPDSILFRADAGRATMWITRDGINYRFTRRIEVDSPQGVRNSYEPRHWGDEHGYESDSIEIMIVKAEFVGANPDVRVSELDELRHKYNYFLGNDRTKWQTNVPNYSGITIEDLYPGVDLVYRGSNGKFEYELVAESQAKLSLVKVEYKGALPGDITSVGSTELQTRLGKLSCSGILISNSTEPIMQESQSLSPSSIVVSLGYSTYLGGQEYEEAYGEHVDQAGNAYVTGVTGSSQGTDLVWFPTLNPIQPDQGGWDIFLSKFDSTGSLIYSTYLGGNSEDRGIGVCVDTSGAMYLTGLTHSDNFPLENPYQTLQRYDDVFVMKLSSAGDSLIYSTLLGGEDEDAGKAIVVDNEGCAYVTGLTLSDDFPTENPYQIDQDDQEWDAFVTKLSPSGSSLIYSTYLGGVISDRGEGIAVDVSGNAYVVGGTYSPDFPTENPYQTDPGIDYIEDAFVTKLSASGNSLIYSTYLGGSNTDRGQGIALDASGNAYVTGYTYSNDFPTENPYQVHQGNFDAFVTKLNSAGDSLVFSTYLGGSDTDRGRDICIDASGNAFVTGETYSGDFPVEKAYQSDHAGGYLDVFVTKLNSSGNSLVYSTFLGGGDSDWGQGISVDASGNVFVTGGTFSVDFPTENPFQTDQGHSDAFVTKLRVTCCGAYTSGQTGNTNCDSDGKRNLADITLLIDHVYISKAELCCNENGNINGDVDGKRNLADITVLIDHVYISKTETAACE